MATEYFVNQPEYQHIMNLISELGGLDLDDLLQRMSAAEQQIAALETWQGTTDTALETITDDIDTIEGNVSDMESAETARNTWHDVLAWGNYYTAGQQLLLLEDLSNIDTIYLVAGQVNSNQNYGYGVMNLPKGYFNPGVIVTVPFYVGATTYRVSVEFVDNTHIKIRECTYSGNLGLRIITGKRR